ncbi:MULTISPECIES: CAP domain-containing protein [Bacillaceae]|uniref:CAP domain-containing protein n=2 Tax=Bacillales TaxID=1385 RepID=UPI0037CBA535
MKTLLRIVIIISILLAVWFYMSITDTSENSDALVDDGTNSAKVDEGLSEEADEDTSISMPEEGLGSMIGSSAKDLVKKYGEPARKDPSNYEYEWWIYNQDSSKYFQVGVLDDKVVTIFAIGQDVNIAPYKIGEEIGNIYEKTPIETNISLNYEDSSYRFELSEDEINNRPLVKMGDYYVQLYFDKFTGTLSSVRYMDARTLLQIRPYELVYRGELLEADLVVKENEAVEDGNERQILDITNVIRSRFNLGKVQWDEDTATVALGHSVDMYDTKNFSHTSDKYGDLEERLKTGDVFYQLAGENIAAGYTDAAAVMEGWLNSKGHRECLLNESFTHLGVGVYNKYYTQNFIEKW